MEIHRYGGILALALSVILGGCGPELLGGAQGEVRTVATSDDTDDGSQGSAGASPARSVSTATAAAMIEGELSITAAAWLVTEEGEAVALTDGYVPGSFRIEGGDDALIGRVDVTARTYSAVRVTFTSVSALVEGGLVIGGAPIIGNVVVQLPSGGLTMERPVQVAVEPHTSTTLVLDLNAHAWLPATTLPSRTVAAGTFASAVEIRVR